MKTGSCLCGAVAFEINGPMGPVTACHCTQCRKMTGNYWASFHVADADLKFTRTDGLKWFDSSDFAKRGFCKECGSTLFWKKNDSNETSICPGSIDGKFRPGRRLRRPWSHWKRGDHKLDAIALRRLKPRHRIRLIQRYRKATLTIVNFRRVNLPSATRDPFSLRVRLPCNGGVR